MLNPFFQMEPKEQGILWINRNIKLLVLQSVVTQFCFGMLLVVWQPYMLGLGTTFTQLGTIQAVITIFTGVGSLAWGRLSDRYGRKPVHIASMLARMIGILFIYTSSNWTGFLGFGIFIGLSASWSQTNPVTTTIISESVKEEKMNTAISLYSSVGTLIAVIASPLGGYLAAEDSHYLIFISCIVGELVNSLVSQLFLTETLDNEEAKESGFDLRKLLIPERVILPFYLMSILTMFSWRVAFSNLNAILVDSYGLTTVQLGLMSSAFSISWGLTQTPIGVIIDRYPKRQFLVISRIGFLVIVLIYIFFDSFHFFLLAQIVNGVAHSFGIPAFTSMILTRVDKSERATVLAKLSTLPQIVSVPAPIIGGYFYERYGFKILLINRVIFLVISILVILFWISSAEEK
ncbi:MFS transporter [Candidatus Bathyarchaeota archaeon]|nr:MFS transporter [Candidatus Bathyarchaeota archaeon]